MSLDSYLPNESRIIRRSTVLGPTALPLWSSWGGGLAVTSIARARARHFGQVRTQKLRKSARFLQSTH